jgi:hypothetical protein
MPNMAVPASLSASSTTVLGGSTGCGSVSSAAGSVGGAGEEGGADRGVRPGSPSSGGAVVPIGT